MLNPPTMSAILASMILSPAAYSSEVRQPSECARLEEGGAFDYDFAPRVAISEKDAWAMLGRMDYHSTSSATHVALSVIDISDATQAEDAASLVSELRRMSGLTWAQISKIFGVSNRTPYHWASGKNVSSDHHQRLGKVVALVRYFDRGSAEENKKLLLSEAREGHTYLDLLSLGKDDEVRELVGKGKGRLQLPSSLSGGAEKLRAPEHWGESARLLSSSEIVEVPIAKSNLRKTKSRRKKA